MFGQNEKKMFDEFPQEKQRKNKFPLFRFSKFGFTSQSMSTKTTTKKNKRQRHHYRVDRPLRLKICFLKFFVCLFVKWMGFFP